MIPSSCRQDLAESIPLENYLDGFAIQLGKALWGWQLCSACLSDKKCDVETCPSRRAAQLQCYSKFYRAVVSTYVDSFAVKDRVLKTHSDLWDAFKALTSNPDLCRVDLYELLQSKSFGSSPGSINKDMQSATTLVVKLLLMVDCSALHQSFDRLERGGYRIHWKDDVAFAKYLQDLFPTENHSVFSYPDKDNHDDVKSEMRARKLKKHLGIAFLATSDIRNHLRFNRKHNVVEIFHHTAFLKEHLRLTKGAGDWSSPSSSLKIGALPRQLVLEVLDSLHGILFPLCDSKSKSLLQSLVSASDFDPDILNFEFTSIRRVGEDNVTYIYFADRLSDLYNELQNPRPRGWIERQLQRKSSARHMMMATLLGVTFAILLGIVSLAVTSYQTWITYQAWQHPVPRVSS